MIYLDVITFGERVVVSATAMGQRIAHHTTVDEVQHLEARSVCRPSTTGGYIEGVEIVNRLSGAVIAAELVAA